MKTPKKLSNLIKLSSNVKIYVPTTKDVNNKLKQEIIDKYVDDTLSFLSSLFGGSTSFNAVGCWKSNEELIKEKIIICESYCNQKELERSIDNIIDYCERIKKELTQEAISLEINNELYFI